MDGNRKRKRVEDEISTVLTFHAPGNRVFDRLFKDASLEDLKAGVKKKLGVPTVTDVRLAQLREGKRIDLEDDDDFDALRARAYSNSSMDIVVALGESNDFSHVLNAPRTSSAAAAPVDTLTPKRKKRKTKAQTPAANDRPRSDAVPVAGLSEFQGHGARSEAEFATRASPSPEDDDSRQPVTPTKAKLKQLQALRNNGLPSPSILKKPKPVGTVPCSSLTTPGWKETSTAVSSPNVSNQAAEARRSTEHQVSHSVSEPEASSSAIPDAEPLADAKSKKPKKQKKRKLSLDAESALNGLSTEDQQQNAKAGSTLSTQTPAAADSVLETDALPAIPLKKKRKKDLEALTSTLQPQVEATTEGPAESSKRKSKSKKVGKSGTLVVPPPSTEVREVEPSLSNAQPEVSETPPPVPETSKKSKKKSKARSTQAVPDVPPETSQSSAEPVATSNGEVADNSKGSTKSKGKKKTKQVEDVPNGDAESTASVQVSKSAEISLPDVFNPPTKKSKTRKSKATEALSTTAQPVQQDSSPPITPATTVDTSTQPQTSKAKRRPSKASASAVASTAPDDITSVGAAKSKRKSTASTMNSDELAAKVQEAVSAVLFRNLASVSATVSGVSKATGTAAPIANGVVSSATPTVSPIINPVVQAMEPNTQEVSSLVTPAAEQSISARSKRASAATKKKTTKKEIACPVCETVPFHLRYLCPVFKAGPVSIEKRIAELKESDGDQLLIEELEKSLQKARKNDAPPTDTPLKSTILSERRSASDDIFVAPLTIPSTRVSTVSSQAPSESISAALTSSRSQLSTSSRPDNTSANGQIVPESASAAVQSSSSGQLARAHIPAGSAISEVPVESQGEGSSDEEDDTSTESENEQGEPVVSIPPTTQIPNVSGSLESIDLEALLRGPVRPSSQILATLSSDSSSEDEKQEQEMDEDEDAELEEEKNDRAFRRLSKRFQRDDSPSSDDADMVAEDAPLVPPTIMDPDANASSDQQKESGTSSATTSASSEERAVEDTVGRDLSPEVPEEHPNGDSTTTPGDILGQTTSSAAGSTAPEESDSTVPERAFTSEKPRPATIDGAAGPTISPRNEMGDEEQSSKNITATVTEISIQDAHTAQSPSPDTISHGPPESPLPISDVRTAEGANSIDIELFSDPPRTSRGEDPTDPIEPAEDLIPTQPIVAIDDDSIELDHADQETDVRITPPPASPARPGTAKRMKNRQGKVPQDDSELPVPASELIAESTPAPARTTRATRRTASTTQIPASKPSQDIPNGTENASQKPSSAALMPPPPVPAAENPPAPAPAPAAKPAPKRRGRPPADPEEKARREALKQAERDRKAAEKAAAKAAREAAKQAAKEQKQKTAAARATRSRKAAPKKADAPEIEDQSALIAVPVVTKDTEQPPSSTSEGAGADNQASQLSVVQWTTLPILTSPATEHSQVDELRSSSPPPANEPPTSPSISSSAVTQKERGAPLTNGGTPQARPNSSQPSSQATQGRKTPRKSTSTPRGRDDPLFLPGSQFPDSQLIDSSIEIPGQSGRERSASPSVSDSQDEGETPLQLKKPLVRPNAWTAAAKFRRLSDLNSQALFPTPTPTSFFSSSQRSNVPASTGANDEESEDESSSSSEDEDVDRSHIPKNRRAGTSRKPKKGLLSYA
ncbi:unnamed protein product [Somion occarium]|uniref:Nucleolar protein Dnt1-like N-terminal domain-containing protein n=1 Tax=Somion occarium TaxID=3059160 RepID=A0ABP1DL61_9APHY